MNIQIISDIHTETRSDQGRKILQRICGVKNVDALIVAGDLGTIKSLRYAFSILCNEQENVVYVPGNHEYWSSSPDQTHDLLQEMCDKYQNLHWLNNSSVTIKGQTFLGGTLWFPKNAQTVGNAITYTVGGIYKWADFSEIKGFEPWIWEQFQTTSNYIANNVKENDIIVTHHIPFEQSVAPRWKKDSFNCYFFADMSYKLKDCNPAKLIIHGHGHDKFDYMIGCSDISDQLTRVVAHPLGYIKEHERQLKLDKNCDIKVIKI